MNGICLANSEEVTRQQVEAVPVPVHTDSWRPVAYGDVIEHLHEQTEKQLGLEVLNETYGLNKAGDQMFALLTMKTDREDNGLSIGLRQSYNKSLALGVAVGSQVFVCDNLCFSGDAFRVVRKNTVNVWRDFKTLLNRQISDSLEHYQSMNDDMDRMKELPCPLEEGFEKLGVMMGRGLLTPRQASVTFEEWKKPTHEEFKEDNVWSLYNAVTEGLKKGPPGRLIDRHVKAHSFFNEVN